MDKEGGFVNRPPLLDGSNYVLLDVAHECFSQIN